MNKLQIQLTYYELALSLTFQHLAQEIMLGEWGDQYIQRSLHREN